MTSRRFSDRQLTFISFSLICCDWVVRCKSARITLFGFRLSLSNLILSPRIDTGALIILKVKRYFLFYFFFFGIRREQLLTFFIRFWRTFVSFWVGVYRIWLFLSMTYNWSFTVATNLLQVVFCGTFFSFSRIMRLIVWNRTSSGTCPAFLPVTWNFLM